MAKKNQTNARRMNAVAGKRVVYYYNHGTINVDARQNNSTTRRQEYSGCTFNGVAEYDGCCDKHNHVPTTGTQASSPETTVTNEKKGSKKSILLMAGTALLMVGVWTVLLGKTKKLTRDELRDRQFSHKIY